MPKARLLSLRLSVGLLAALSFIGLGFMASAAAPVDFSGKWTLNAQRSDDIAAAIGNATGPETLKGRSDKIERLAVQTWMKARADEIRTLEIEQTPTEIKFLDQGTVSIFYFGRKHVRQIGPEKLECQTRWQGSQLVIEQDAAIGLRMSNLFTLQPDGKQLVSAVQFHGKPLQKPLEVRLIYDRAK
jgi:hypothetical protein